MNSEKHGSDPARTIPESLATERLDGTTGAAADVYPQAVAMETAARKRRRRSHPWSVVLLSIGLIAVLTALVNLQNISDWWRLRGYTAPAIVSELATQDTMTAYARRIFYVNRPATDSGAAFNASCLSHAPAEKTIVLGCYHGGQNGIFLLPVSDPLLNGVEQVTAAHEMLHAAYDRLSSSQRAKVDAMLSDYYSHDLHDQRILDTIAAYKKSEPKDVVNEMHSVFGTEVAVLPAGLEQYYQRYFTDRGKIAGYAAAYQAEFTSREATLQQDDTQLSSLKTQIDNLENDLKTKLAAINSQQSALVAERSRGDIASYNAGVPGYNDAVDAYNVEIAQLQSLISQYNQLVVSRNAVALEEDHLASELDSTATQINK